MRHVKETTASRKLLSTSGDVGGLYHATSLPYWQQEGAAPLDSPLLSPQIDHYKSIMRNTMPFPSEEKRPLILYRANVLTMDPKMPSAEAVWVDRGRIVEVGKDSEVERWLTPSSSLIDCEGKTLAPGFIDAHCHLFSYAASLFSVDLTPDAIRSIEEMKTAIKKRAQTLPKGSWIRGRGYNEFYLDDHRHPNRWDLDKAAPHHPVRIIHRSGHASVLNSLALQLVGISLETPEPDGGMIDRDIYTANPNGMIFDMEDFPPLKEQSGFAIPEIENALSIASENYLSQGITSIHDATPFDSLEQLTILGSLQDEGRFIPRVWKMVGLDALPSLQKEGLLFQSGNDQLRVGAIKIFLNQTNGTLHPRSDDLNAQVAKARRAGFPLAIHSVEENTLRAALDALEHAKDPRQNTRDRIEHCSICPPTLLRRLQSLNTTIVTQPAFLHYNGERYLAEIPETDIPWLYRVKSLLEAGLPLAAGSDSPVVPNNPFIGLHSAVTRLASSGDILKPEEAIEPYEALGLFTKGAAYAASEEHIKGKIAPGYLADLVLMSDDPTRTPYQDIPKITVEKTFLKGLLAWERD